MAGADRLRPVEVAAVAAAILAYALIVLGALVRSTNSGLSCPDWPTCYGLWVLTPADFAALPATGYTYLQVMLEWVHRFIAGVLLGPLVLLLAVLAFRRRHAAPDLAIAGGVLVLLLLVQGALGGLTVLDRNSPWSVALHLGNALVLLTVLIGMAVRAGPVPAGPVPSAVPALAVLAWGLALAAMVTAAMTAKSGASLACSTWPSCEGALIPSLDDPLVRIHVTHRALAACVAVALVALWLAARHAAPALRRLAAACVVLVVCQIGLGALVIVLEVPIWKAVLHQAVGVLTFAAVTTLLWRAQRARAGAVRGTPRHEGSGDGLALRGA